MGKHLIVRGFFAGLLASKVQYLRAFALSLPNGRRLTLYRPSGGRYSRNGKSEFKRGVRCSAVARPGEPAAGADFGRATAVQEPDGRSEAAGRNSGAEGRGRGTSLS